MKQNNLTKFFLLTYLVSWIFFISAVFLSYKSETESVLNILQQALIFLGAITPSIVVLWLNARHDKSGQTQILLNKTVQWNVNIKWYLFAVFFLIVIKLLVAIIYKFIAGVWPQFGKETWYIMAIAIVFSTWVQAGEEIGWRGFALPRMTATWGLPISTLVLGVIWAFWHLPLFFIKGVDKFGQSFPLYLIQVIAISVVIGWLYWRTHGSLLLPMLLHASINNTKDIVPSIALGASNPFAWSQSLVAWLTAILLWIFAGYCLLHMRNVKTLE